MGRPKFRLEDVDSTSLKGNSEIYGSLRLEDKNKGYEDRSFCFCQCDPQCECNTECRENYIDPGRRFGCICNSQCRCEGQCPCETDCRCDCKHDDGGMW